MKQKKSDKSIRLAIDIGGTFTDLATHTLIERRGARTALVTTKGFRDCLEIGYEFRHHQYDLYLKKSAPLVSCYLRLPVSERTLSNGVIDTKLDPKSILSLIPD